VNYISHVKITGFWGDRTFKLKFFDDVTFLIGVNGSGKTTVINLIRAAIQGDAKALIEAEFDELEIGFSHPSLKSKPSITITKPSASEHDSRGFFYSGVRYSVKTKASGKALVFNLDSDGDVYWLSRHVSSFLKEKGVVSQSNENSKRRAGSRRSHSERGLKQERFYIDMFDDMPASFDRNGINIVLAIIKNIVNVSWLSIHRSNPNETNSKEPGSLSSVDRKLLYVANRLVRYFSELTAQASAKLLDFQESVFLSMLASDTDEKIKFDPKLDVHKEKESLIKIFSHFKLDKESYQNRINKHFDLVTDGISVLKDNHKNSRGKMRSFSLSTFILNQRIDSLVQEWNVIEQDREEIIEPRVNFLAIVNSLMQRKSFSVDSRNELRVTTQSGKNLPLTLLSSGEKQLLIVLAEALLQEKKSWVYIADEPELSLHVNWQETLVDNLKQINPNAQVIFATHSPDIIGHYGSNVIDMEKVL